MVKFLPGTGAAIPLQKTLNQTFFVFMLPNFTLTFDSIRISIGTGSCSPSDRIRQAESRLRTMKPTVERVARRELVFLVGSTNEGMDPFPRRAPEEEAATEKGS